MRGDRGLYRELGANGVVIGALTPDGELDLAQHAPHDGLRRCGWRSRSTARST